MAPDGTVSVSTAQYGNRSASILTYPPGATKPASSVGQLAGDAVASLQTNDRGNVFFAADFIDAPGYVGELGARAVRRIVNLGDDTQVTNSQTYSAFYAASGIITKYAYPGGARLDTITSLAADNTFGIATFPRVPYALAH